MFKELTNFSHKRNWKEAVGFYLAYLLVGLILGAIGGGLVGIQSDATTFNEGFNASLEIGAIIGTIYSLAITFAILIKRKLYKNFGLIVLALLSGLLAVFGGLLFALLIPAFLTTRRTVTT